MFATAWAREFAFQSTLPRRERHASITPNAIVQHFNPRSREGSDTPSRKDYYIRCISIHAPAKGATRAIRPAAGLMPFQSTLPRRERHSNRAVIRLPCNDFNPRSREGSDLKIMRVQFYPKVFQSTLPRRERRACRPYPRHSDGISIHAPAKGATLLYVTDIPEE